MSTKIERRSCLTGCLLPLAILAGLAVLGFQLSGWFFILAVVVAVVCAIWIHRDAEAMRDKERSMVVVGVKRCFAEFKGGLPEFEIGNSYGLPLITLTFPSKADRDLACESGCFVEFSNLIQSYYGSHGSKGRPFDAGLAVHLSYAGWEEDLRNTEPVVTEALVAETVTRPKDRITPILIYLVSPLASGWMAITAILGEGSFASWLAFSAGLSVIFGSFSYVVGFRRNDGGFSRGDYLRSLAGYGFMQTVAFALYFAILIALGSIAIWVITLLEWWSD